MIVNIGHTRSDYYLDDEITKDQSPILPSRAAAYKHSVVCMAGRIGPHAVHTIRLSGLKFKGRMEIGDMDVPLFSVSNLAGVGGTPFMQKLKMTNIVRDFDPSRLMREADIKRSLLTTTIENASLCSRAPFPIRLFKFPERSTYKAGPVRVCPRLMLGQPCDTSSCAFSHNAFHLADSYQAPCSARHRKEAVASTTGLNEFRFILPIVNQCEQDFYHAQRPSHRACIGCPNSNCMVRGGMACLESSDATCAHYVCYRCGQGNVKVHDGKSYRKFSDLLYAKTPTPAVPFQCDCDISHKVFYLPRCSNRVGLPLNVIHNQVMSFKTELAQNKSQKVYYKHVAGNPELQKAASDTSCNYATRSGLDFTNPSVQMESCGAFKSTAPCFGTMGVAILFERYLGYEFKAYESNFVFATKVDEILNDPLVRIVLGLSVETVLGIPFTPESPDQ